MSQVVPNEIRRDLLGVAALNFAAAYTSSSRQQMFCGHIGQSLVIKGSTERRIQTGMEREFGKYTFSIKMPVDGKIIRVIERYPRRLGSDSIAFNPQTVVIYENIHTKEVGVLDIPTYCSHHQYFGFEYKPTEALSKVRTGETIPAGTILLDSPSVTPTGGYKYGKELNIAYMSHPSVSEDGVMICEDVLPALQFKTYETRIVEWGGKKFPLNLYGTRDFYKAFPEIGDLIRPDGLLACLREFDPNMAIVEQSVYDTMEPDFIFDKLVYAGGPGENVFNREGKITHSTGKVIDIRIFHDQGGPNEEILPTDAMPNKYDIARRHFYQSIYDEWQKLKHVRKEQLEITPEFQRLVVDALAVLDPDQKKLQKLYRQSPLDNWRMEFVIEYTITPNIGFKITDCHGGKGVICKIAKRYEMPIDADGNRADIVMDGNSTVNRMNPGRLYEQYLNAASRDVVKRIKQLLQVSDDVLDAKTQKPLEMYLENIQAKQVDLINTAWDYLMGYYQIVSPQRMFRAFMTSEYRGTKINHLTSILSNGIYLYIPTEHEVELDQVVRELEHNYRPTYGPVSYIGNSGRRVTTKLPVRIGSVYFMLLEKTGDDWTACPSGKLQHFAVLSQITAADKFSQPSREQAIRAFGEAENRIYASYAGPAVTAEIMDRNNNPATHREVVEHILRADKPTDIEYAVNRDRVPLGGAKPLQLVKHILSCAGAKFVYRPYVPRWINTHGKQK